MSDFQPLNEDDGRLLDIKGHTDSPAQDSDDKKSASFSCSTADVLILEDWEKIVEYAPFAIILVQADGTFRYVNRKFQEIFGYDLGDVPCGKEWVKKAHPDGAYRQEALSLWINDLREIAAGEKTSRIFPVICKDHSEKTVNFAFVRLGDGQSLVSCEDITEQKRMQEALLRERNEAQAADRAKSEFLANMSHEIRTPMNAVIGLTDLLLDEDLTATQREYLETIRSSGDSLLSIINNILDLSKIEAGMIELECRPLPLAACLEESISQVAAIASEKGLELAYRMAEETPRAILGDPTRLKQILVNLLSNAVKFTERGEVKAYVSAVPKKDGEDGEHEIHFAITDTGIGIPADRMSRLFVSFSQIDASTTRRYGGTGLGLAISKRLVDQMGGKIWAESVPGRGSTFNITIPAKASVQVPAGREASLGLESHVEKCLGEGGCLSILLAEDNAVNQKVTVQMLSKLGYRADVAENGIEVLQRMESNRYDVILMDILMPEMDGLEATRRIRLRWPKGPRIIAMTASVLKGDRDMCFAAGMDGFISKPAKIEELKAALQSCRPSMGC